MPPREQFKGLDDDINEFISKAELSDELAKDLKTLLFKVQMQGSSRTHDLIYEGVGSWCRHQRIDNDCVGRWAGHPIHQQIQMLLTKLYYRGLEERSEQS